MIASGAIDLRCSAVLLRGSAVLLVHRTVDSSDDWVLPGGSPRIGETMQACARRELREETGLDAEPARVLLVLEAIAPETGLHTVDIVFTAKEYGPARMPELQEAGLEPVFIQLDVLADLDLRPPIAGHLRGTGAGRLQSAPYLGNMWRPKDRAAIRLRRGQP
jgi:ADP-ribose pyrophosphatase YjhB (NUDIX family)